MVVLSSRGFKKRQTHTCTSLEILQDQINMHVDPDYCTDKPGKEAITFVFSGNMNQRRRMNELNEKVQKQSHFPFLFIDKAGSKKLPPPQFLAMFRIVITSNQRFTNEWRNGSFEAELKLKREEDSATNAQEDDHKHDALLRMGRREFERDLAQSAEACPLLKINWLRMVVDEGMV